MILKKILKLNLLFLLFLINYSYSLENNKSDEEKEKLAEAACSP